MLYLIVLLLYISFLHSDWKCREGLLQKSSVCHFGEEQDHCWWEAFVTGLQVSPMVQLCNNRHRINKIFPITKTYLQHIWQGKLHQQYWLTSVVFLFGPFAWTAAHNQIDPIFSISSWQYHRIILTFCKNMVNSLPLKSMLSWFSFSINSSFSTHFFAKKVGMRTSMTMEKRYLLSAAVFRGALHLPSRFVSTPPKREIRS